MVDFRRWILAFGTLVVLLGLARPASAQYNIVCSAAAPVVPTLRHEGFTELTGDIRLTCVAAPGSTPTPPGTVIQQTTITVTLNAPVTSRILSGPGNLTEALLLVDDPSPANQDPCLSPTNPAVNCQVSGDGGQTFNQPGKFNVFQGILGVPGTDSITFLGVPVDPAVASRTYRITNVRIDATALPAGQYGLTPVYGSVSANPSSSIQIGNPQNYVGFAANGLSLSYANTNPNLPGCPGASHEVVGTVTFMENFANAFKVRTNGLQNVPGVVYYSESGLQISVSDGTTGYADTGTRLQTVISNIPSGVSIWVDNWASSTAAFPGFASDATLATGPSTPSDPGFNTITQITNGTQSSATVVWEVTNTNPSAIDSIAFNIYASFNAGAAAANVTAAALSGFSPQSAAYSSSGPIPEFSSTVNVAISPTNLFDVSQCQTLVSPAPGTVLSGSLADFSWDSVSSATAYELSVGTTAGGTNIFTGTTTGTSQTVGNIPCTGGTVYVQLAAEVGGSFQPASDYSYACKSVIGDFNGDHHQDLVWQNDSTRQVTVNYYGGVSPVFQNGWNWLDSAGIAGWHVVGAADFDGNGVPDLVWQDDATRQVVVNYYGGAGGAVYQGWAYLDAAGEPGWTVVGVADMNGDGVPDLIWQNTTTTQVVVHYYGGAGGAVYQGSVSLDAVGAPGWTVVGVADFDGNGTPDLVWQNTTTTQVVVHYYGYSFGAPVYQSWAYLDAAGSPGWTVRGAADLNADGVPDLVWQNNTTGQVVVHFYGGAGGAVDEGWNWLNEATTLGWQVAAVADFDGNGEPDLVWQDDTTRQVSVNYYYLGGAVYQGWNWLDSTGVPGWTLVGTGDFDGNGVPDLVWQNDSTRQVVVHYYGYSGGAPVYQSWAYLDAAAEPGWTVVGVADMNGDGVPDLIWQNTSTTQVVVHYYGGAGGAVYQSWAYLDGVGAPGWTVVGAADFDGNGVPDLIWQNQSTRQVVVHYYGGAGGAVYQGWAYLDKAGVPGWTVAGASDFDGNGVPDLIWQNDSSGQVVVHYYGGAGGAVYKGWNWLNSTANTGWRVIVPESR